MRWIVVVPILFLSTSSSSSIQSVDIASAFLASLTAEQRAEALLNFGDDARTAWMYVPGNRAGITLRKLGEVQRKAGIELLKSSLSEAGFKKVESIRLNLESTLKQMEGNPGRDSEQYFFAFFGEPKPKGKWGWRFEGHHVSLSFTYLDGRIVSTSPQFLGSNPAEVREGPLKGLRVLGIEEDLGRRLVRSLNPAQQKFAIIGDEAPADIVTSNKREAAILDDKGIAYPSLEREQAANLMAIVQVFAEVQKPEQAKVRIAKIEKAGWEKVRFAWMGRIEPGQGHYYRIQGPTFLIEYDNTQNNANHIHAVWRDFKGDFGRDALLEHYETSPHHQHRH